MGGNLLIFSDCIDDCTLHKHYLDFTSAGDTWIKNDELRGMHNYDFCLCINSDATLVHYRACVNEETDKR